MAECPLRIINRTRLLQMFLAAVLIVTGLSLASTAKEAVALTKEMRYILTILGMVLFIGGWLMVGYRFYQTIPEQAMYFFPAIVAIIISTLLMRFANVTPWLSYPLYIVGWAIFGWVISKHIDGSDRWLGPSASILAVISMVGLLPWQRQNNVVDGLGLPLYVGSWVLVSIVHAYPTVEGIKESGPDCLTFLGNKVPEIKPYVEELECVMKSGCFDEVSKLEPEETPEYISKVVEAVACAGEKCTTFKTISQEIECVVKNCLPEILKQKPDTAMKWASVLMQEYPKCQKTCNLQSIF